MSKLLNIAAAAGLGIAACMPVFAATAVNTEAWSESRIKSAMDKCNGLTGTERARCTVNIRPAGGGGSSLAVSVPGDTVKQAQGSDEDFMAEIKKCDGAKDPERCIADVKDHFGRM